MPTQMNWMVIVLLPKGRGDYRGLGLLNPMWKVVEKLMVAQMSCLELHYCLHGGLPRWGMGTAIMEVKLNQQLAWVDQAPLYQIYLDLKKDMMPWFEHGALRSWLVMRWSEMMQMVCHSGGNVGESFFVQGGFSPVSCSMLC